MKLAKILDGSDILIAVSNAQRAVKENNGSTGMGSQVVMDNGTLTNTL